MKMAARKGRNDHDHYHDHDDIGRVEQLLDEQQLEEIYAWVDSIPLTRPKKDIKRDFSDGVLVAELVKHFFPKDEVVQLHNYTACFSTNKKLDNWFLLNRKVFSKLNFELDEDVIKDLVCCKLGCIEKVLMLIKSKIDRAMYAKERRDKPEAEQHEVSPGRKGANIKVAIDQRKGGKLNKAKQEDQTKDTKVKNNTKVKVTPEEGKKIGSTVRAQPSSVRGQQAGVPKKRVGNMAEPELVPRYVVEEKEQEVLSRDETIQILLAKIDRLEHLLKLKDMKILELQKNLQKRTEAQIEYQYNSSYNPNQKPRYYR